MNTKPSFHVDGYHLPKDLSDFGDREKAWLWSELAQNDQSFPRDLRTGPGEIEQKMAEFIKAHQSPEQLIANIAFRKKNLLVNKEHFEWIEKGDYRLKYTALLMTSNPSIGLSHSLPIHQIPPLNWDKEIQLAVDKWEISLIEKEQHLDHIKHKWSIISQSKESKWLDKRDETQVEWTWEYMGKNHKAIGLLNPINTKEAYISALISIDHASFPNSAERILFLEKMKKSWRQYKHRNSGRVKKQVPIPMTETTKKKFEQVLQHELKSTAEVAEEIIQLKHESIYGKKK